MRKTPARPAPKAPLKDSPELMRASRRVMIFGALLVLTLITQTLDLPWRLVTVAVGLSALMYGIRAVIGVWKVGMRGLVIPAIGIGAIMSALMAFSTALSLFVWGIEMDFQDCRAGAITVSASEQCTAEYKSAITNWRTSVESRAKGISTP